MLTHLLGQSDYEVTAADSLAVALDLTRREKFDLYILDKRLPDGSGLELCRRLHQATPDVPVIFYTGDAYQLHRQEGLDAGARAYVAKPNIDELVERVNEVLSRQECSAAAG